MSGDFILIKVAGTPAPQGSKRGFRNQHTGRIQMVESSTAVQPWRQDVKHAALMAVGPDWTPLTGPLSVHMRFMLPRPKGHWRTGRNAGLLRDSAPAFPHGRPDLSKLARSTEDALTGVVWADDAQVVSELLEKVYPVPDTLPGCLIWVTSILETVGEHAEAAIAQAVGGA